MSTSPARTVQITFTPPRRRNQSESSAFHERLLENVPKSTAQQISQDFTAYEERPSEAKQHKLYKYQRVGAEAPNEEAVVALDFGEVAGLTTLND